jgi:flagellar assembly protein FliH
MAQPQRFLFDVSFDRLDEDDGNGPGSAAKPRFTQAELEAARAEGMAQGRSAALAEATRSTEARLADACQALSSAIEQIVAERTRLENETERAAIGLVRAVLHRAFPALAARDPLAELEGFVARTLGEVFDEPRIVLRVSDALFEPLRDRLPALSQAAGYSGKLVLLADPALTDGDGRIEWADGGAERDLALPLTELDQILSRPASPACSAREPEEISHD